ncbi:Lrp/AsnC family transcriptional regulator [Vibrio sp. F74]|uniref:Lrp/AsnC family transcriptional regulator n=1 Tax=Vibrio sp. F74 TaxID=700020 RepID=UPI0035F576E3
MDEFERQILRIMQSNTRKTSEEIGFELGLSASSVQRRINKLRKSGVITKEIAVLNGTEVGGYVTVIVEILMIRGGATIMDGFKDKVEKCPEVQQCYYVAGDTDFVLIITAENMKKYEEITRELFLNDSTIHKFRTNVVMKDIKIGLNIPI